MRIRSLLLNLPDAVLESEMIIRPATRSVVEGGCPTRRRKSGLGTVRVPRTQVKFNQQRYQGIRGSLRIRVIFSCIFLPASQRASSMMSAHYPGSPGTRYPGTGREA